VFLMFKWSRRTVTVAIAALSALVLSLVVTTSNSSADTTAPLPVEQWTQAQIDARYQQFRERINDLLAQGKSQSEIDATIAEEFGIVRIVSDTSGIEVPGTTVEPMSTTASQVSMYTPTFSYDTLLRKYVMAASWQWKQCSSAPCWTNDRSSPGNTGGPDGMAIKINRPIYRYSAGISTNDNCGTPKINNSQADTDTGYGVAFIEQDAVTYDGGTSCAGSPVRYNWHRGTVSETFTFQSNCASIQLQIDSKIGHTWSTTSVNSISISTSGIGYSWSSTSYRWNAIPTTPAYSYC
jgi:hypothetical protein